MAEPKKSLNPLVYLKAAAFYPAEYVLMLILSFVSLVTVSLLGAAVIGHWFDQDVGATTGSGVLFLVSLLVITVPLHLGLYWRVRHANLKTLTTLSQRVANSALGLYLLLTAGATILLSVWFLHAILDAVFGSGQVNSAFWVGLLVLVQAIAWFKYATFHFLRSRVKLARSKYYVLTVGLASLIIVLLALIFPAAAGRDASSDLTRQNDLGEIEAAVNSYATDQGRLPAQLDELDSLNPEVVNRLSDYTYRPLSTDEGNFDYELCATFATKAGTGADPGFGYFSHKAGNQCFQRNADVGAFNLDFNNQDAGTLENGEGLQQTLEQFLQNSGDAEDFYQFDSGEL